MKSTSSRVSGTVARTGLLMLASLGFVTVAGATFASEWDQWNDIDSISYQPTVSEEIVAATPTNTSWAVQHVVEELVVEEAPVAYEVVQESTPVTYDFDQFSPLEIQEPSYPEDSWGEYDITSSSSPTPSVDVSAYGNSYVSNPLVSLRSYCNDGEPGCPPIGTSPSCGSNAKSYAANETYFSGDFCNPGLCDDCGTTGLFPIPGSTSTWYCLGQNGSASCTAYRETCPTGTVQIGDSCVISTPTPTPTISPSPVAIPPVRPIIPPRSTSVPRFTFAPVRAP